jgi:hypothetical protein
MPGDDEPQSVRFKGSPWTGLEAAAVGFLAAGGLLFPVIGPMLALVLVWLSQRWTTRQKALGSLIAAYPLLLVIAGIAMGVDEDTDLGPADWLVVLGFPLSGAVAAIYLSIMLNRSGRQE